MSRRKPSPTPTLGEISPARTKKELITQIIKRNVQ